MTQSTVPLCFDCKNNHGDRCAVIMPYFPSRLICTSQIVKGAPPQATGGEFKVYAEGNPAKLLRYALLP